METHQQSDPLVGAVLDGRYRVDTLIATGGMSGVYRGLDLRLDRPVALKIMDSRYAGDSQFLTRFQREARAVAKLKDPGLVAVYDQGIDGQHPFLVMELIEGGTLRELLVERGPMRRRCQDRRLRVGTRDRGSQDHLDQCHFGHRGIPLARAGQQRRCDARQ